MKLNSDGLILQATKQGKKQKPKKNIGYKNAIKQICLNCDSKKCNGNCKKLRNEIERIKKYE